MKLVRYEHNGFAHVGVIQYDQIHSLDAGVDVLEILNLPRRERDYLQARSGRMHRVDIDKVRLLPPVEPRAMRDFVSFEAHIAGMKKTEGGTGAIPEQWYQAPTFMFMNPWSLTGVNDDIVPPADCVDLDFELEMAAVIRKQARDVSAKDASDYIGGYLILNDWSARDIQRNEMKVGLGPSKGKDFANTIGPWLTTSDELDERREGDRYDLAMKVWVNGTLIGEDNAKNLSWSFEEMVAHASRGAIVGAGDVLGSGTCSQGALAEFWSRAGKQEIPPLKTGDTVKLGIELLGSIENTIGAPNPPAEKVPPARRTYGEDRL